MDSPLSKASLGDIKRAAARTADCRQRIERAKAAGIDTAEQEIRCDHLHRSLQQLLDIYANSPRPGQESASG